MTVDQIEAQLRRMEVAFLNGETHAGAPAVVIGEENMQDRGTNFSMIGRTDDGRQIWMEFSSPADAQLQDFIVRHSNGGAIPTSIAYKSEPNRVNYWEYFGPPGAMGADRSPLIQYCVTAECAAGLPRSMSAADYLDRRNQNAGVLAHLGRANGRFGAIAGTIGSVPTSPFAPGALVAARGSEVAGWLIGGLEQVMMPNPQSYALGAGVDLGAKQLTGKYSNGAMLFNEIGEYIKSKYGN